MSVPALTSGSARLRAALSPRSDRTGVRFEAVDAARGAALLAMALYHLVWDLGFLRLTPANYALSPPGRMVAHGIAGTFLFLVGASLVLATRHGLRRRPFLLRLARIGGAAALITVATWLAFPGSYIFFGILHCVAASSVLALPFLRLPALFTLAAALFVVGAPHRVHHPVLDAPILLFLGLGRSLPNTNDWVPLFPWFGLVLAGVAVARLGDGAVGRWRARGRLGHAAVVAGRHSLALYLVHQPLLLALLAGLAAITGPHPRAGYAEFRRDYEAHCLRTGGEIQACRLASRCTADALHRHSLWGNTPFAPEQRSRAQGLSQACYAAAEGSAPPLEGDSPGP